MPSKVEEERKRRRTGKGVKPGVASSREDRPKPDRPLREGDTSEDGYDVLDVFKDMDLGDFFTMILAGPGEFLTAKLFQHRRQQQERQAEVAESKAEKERRRGERDFSAFIQEAIRGPQLGVTYPALPEKGILPQSSLPGMPPPAPGMRGEEIYEERDLTSVGEAFMGGLEKGMPVDDLLRGISMFGGMGALFEPDEAAEPEDTIELEKLRSLYQLMNMEGYTPEYLKEVGLIDESYAAEVSLAQKEPDLVESLVMPSDEGDRVARMQLSMLGMEAPEGVDASEYLDAVQGATGMQPDRPNLQLRDGLVFDPSTGQVTETPYYQPPGMEDMGQYDNIGGISLIGVGETEASPIQMSNSLHNAFYGESEGLRQLGITGIQHVGAYNVREARTIEGAPLGFPSTHSEGLALDIKGFYDATGQLHPVTDTADPLVQSARQLLGQFPDFVDEGTVWHTGIGQAGARPQVTAPETVSDREVAVWWGGLTQERTRTLSEQFGEPVPPGVRRADPPANVKRWAYDDAHAGTEARTPEEDREAIAAAMEAAEANLSEEMKLELSAVLSEYLGLGMRGAQIWNTIDLALSDNEITQEQHDYLAGIMGKLMLPR